MAMKLEVRCFEFTMDYTVPLRNLVFIECPDRDIYIAIECFNAQLDKFEVFYDSSLASRVYVDRTKSFNKNGWNQQVCTADVEIDFDNSKDAEHVLIQQISRSMNRNDAIVVLERVSRLLNEMDSSQSNKDESYTNFGAWS